MDIYQQELRLIVGTRNMAGGLKRIDFLIISSGNPLTSQNTLTQPVGLLLDVFSTAVEVILCIIHNVCTYGYLQAGIRADL